MRPRNLDSGLPVPKPVLLTEMLPLRPAGERAAEERASP